MIRDREGNEIKVGSRVVRFCPSEARYLVETIYIVREFDGLQFRVNLLADPVDRIRGWLYPEDVKAIEDARAAEDAA